MYLQITTRCNMRCTHCCYSCSPSRGSSMTRETYVNVIAFARDYTDCIAIGGGEPTLHKDFFTILGFCLQDFDYVWLATNGSRTKSMFRLCNIITGEDEQIYQDDKLTVALSTDYYHDYDMIEYRIRELWTRNAKRRDSGFEVRDVSGNVIREGRATKSGVWNKKEGCVCSDLFITPSGDIKLCGCKKSPVIGNVNTGDIEAKYKHILESEEYQNSKCYKGVKL